MSKTIVAAVEEVGPKLRELRRGQGLTLWQLSQMCDIHTSTLSELENGHHKPQYATVLRVLDALGKRDTWEDKK